MTKNVIASILSAARTLLRSPGALIVLGALYALLISACFLFVTTREATTMQVVSTFVLAIAAPVLFFVLLAGSVNYAQGATSAGVLLSRSAKTFWKIFLVSLPLIALTVLLAYLLVKLQAHIKVAPHEASEAASTLSKHASETTKPAHPPVRWAVVFIVTLRLLLFGVLLPLTAIQLWMTTAREGILAAIVKIFRIMARAFAPQTILTYAIGMILFALIPYFILTTPTHAKSAWLELALFIFRLLVAFVFTLCGWLITMRALAPQETTNLPAPAETL